MTTEDQVREHKIKAESAALEKLGCTPEQVAKHVKPMQPKPKQKPKQKPKRPVAASKPVAAPKPILAETTIKSPCQRARERAQATWRDRFRVHPAAEKLPRMSNAELKALSDDIRQNGLNTPIDFRKVGEEREILDGIHRMDALAMAGIEPTFRELKLNDAEAVRYVISQNAHRRHLTPEQKRQYIADLLKADPSLSDRQIGKATASDHKTVAAQRARMESGGEIPHQEKRKGADGKVQPVKGTVKARKQPTPGSKADLARKAKLQQKTRETFDRTLFIIEQHCTLDDELIVPPLSAAEREAAVGSLLRSMLALGELLSRLELDAEEKRIVATLREAGQQWVARLETVNDTPKEENTNAADRDVNVDSAAGQISA
jgi:hypothetical protein